MFGEILPEKKNKKPPINTADILILMRKIHSFIFFMLFLPNCDLDGDHALPFPNSIYGSGLSNQD